MVRRLGAPCSAAGPARAALAREG